MKLVTIFILICLFASLIFASCAAETPRADEAVPKTQLEEAQSDLAAEQQKSAGLNKQVKDLQAQLEAAQKPAKIYRWSPASWASAGTNWDVIVYMADWLNATSDGQIQMIPSQPGGICPVDEQIEAVSTGMAAAMAPTAAYYVGKIPSGFSISTPLVVRTVEDTQDLFEYYEDGKFLKDFYEEIQKVYNVEFAGTIYYPAPTLIASQEPVPQGNSLKGLKLRTGNDCTAYSLTQFGASTVWMPGSEVYTALSTNVIDAFTYGSAYDYIANSFQEVSKYWVKTPTVTTVATIQFIVNKDEWNSLSDSLKKMLQVATDAATLRGTTEFFINVDQAWATAKTAGVEVVVWPEEDQKAWANYQMEWAQKYSADPVAGEQLNLLLEWGKAKGYL